MDIFILNKLLTNQIRILNDTPWPLGLLKEGKNGIVLENVTYYIRFVDCSIAGQWLSKTFPPPSQAQS